MRKGFEYIQDKPFEVFRVPDVSNPAGACAALLAFAASPAASQHGSRQKASDAFLAWLIRAAREKGIIIKTSPRLTRRHLPPATMRNRVNAACRHFEDTGLNLVGLGMDMAFFRSDGPLEMARLLGAYLGASTVTVQRSSKVGADAGFFRSYLKRLKSQQALDEDHTLQDFRRRVWKVYLPALPLLTAIQMDCLKFNPHMGEYRVAIPGHNQRYLAKSLLLNPGLWLDTVVMSTELRRKSMAPHFPPNTFAHIYGEQELPSWVTSLPEGY